MIELLLVVVVIAIISVAGAQFAASQAMEAKITRTQAQINQIATAGQTYYQANQTWPTQADLESIYLPQLKNTKNPWGFDYVIARDGVKSGSFSVSTEVPDIEVASRLKTSLGSSTVQAGTGTNYKVVTYVGAIRPDPKPTIILKELGMTDSSVAPRQDEMKLGDWPIYGDFMGNLPSAILDENEYADPPGGPISQSNFTNPVDPFIIKKPDCDPNKYEPAYKVFLSGYQKNCMVFAGTDLRQCDDACPTKDIYCRYTGHPNDGDPTKTPTPSPVKCGDPEGTGTWTHFCYDGFFKNYTFSRGPTDECCKEGGMSDFNLCWAWDDINAWNCDAFGTIPDNLLFPSISPGLPYERLNGFALSHVGWDRNFDTEVAYVDDVTVYQSGENSTEWRVKLKVDGVEYSSSDYWGGSMRANDGAVGKLTYMTYCKPK